MHIHSDVLERLWGIPTHPLLWLLIKDQLIECQLQIRALDRGSLDPLVIAIRDQLSEQGEMTIEGLCAKTGGHGPNARRVISELLRVLEMGKEITTEDGRWFKLSRFAGLTERTLTERIVKRSFDFLPRSRRFEPRIKGIAEKKLPNIKAKHGLDWCKLPEDEHLYSDHFLEGEVLAACETYYQNRPVEIYSEENDARLEYLQRSDLAFVDPRFVHAHVLSVHPSDFWVIHKCYLYNTGSWNALVYSYPEGPEQRAYTESMKQLIQDHPDALESLLENSTLV
jgi:hypothetical protein